MTTSRKTLWLALLLALLPPAGRAWSQAPPPPSQAPPPSQVAPPPSGDDYRTLRATAEAALARARARAATLDDVARTVSLPSIELLIEDADRRAATVTNPARDWGFVRRQLATAQGYADQLVAGTDPYRGATGVLVKAYRADLDQTLQPYALDLPRGVPPAAGWPLLVSLHGAYSNHRLNLRRVFGYSNRPGESDEEASRNEVAFPQVPMIVVAPFGRGEFMGFQGLGERDVFQVIADVERAYRVDPDRVYLTGLSMGGEGTWHIGLRHPDLFAAIVPVCGVTDARQWISPATAPLFDPTLLGLTTVQAVAENAANQQVVFYHGDADPTVNVGQSRAMAQRYRQLGWLGKNVRYVELPKVNHFAWEVAYRDGAIFKLLAGIKRDPFPRHVVYKTYSLRYNQAYWLRIDGIDHGLAMAEIEGERTDARLAVRVGNVSAFSLLLDPKYLPGDRAITVEVVAASAGAGAGVLLGGVAPSGAPIFQGAPRPVLSFARAGTGWKLVPEPPPARGAAPDHGASGLFSRALARERPHLYVYGTAGRPEITAANQALANALADWGPGVRARFTVKSDREVTAADIAGLDLVLVGSPRTNALVGRMAGQLAVQGAVDDRADRLIAGGLTLTDADRAYRLACANPLAEGRQALIYAADTERGLGAFQPFTRRNTASSPARGPESNLDYVIFDGAGKIRASGVFRDACAIGR
jgi:poly(3-hydroxybutyrate) depolymerase